MQKGGKRIAKTNILPRRPMYCCSFPFSLIDDRKGNEERKEEIVIQVVRHPHFQEDFGTRPCRSCPAVGVGASRLPAQHERPRLPLRLVFLALLAPWLRLIISMVSAAVLLVRGLLFFLRPLPLPLGMVCAVGGASGLGRWLLSHE